MLNPYNQRAHHYSNHQQLPSSYYCMPPPPNNNDATHQRHHHQQQQRQRRPMVLAPPARGRSVGVADGAIVSAAMPAPPPPLPQRVPSPHCCSSSAATSSVVSEPISLDLATTGQHQQFNVREKENWLGDGPAAPPNWAHPFRRFPPRPLRRTGTAGDDEQLVIPLDEFRPKNYLQSFHHPNSLDDESSEDEDAFDHRRRRRQLDDNHRFDWHARRYSTSDLTTSDSELGRYIVGTGKPYRMGIKCPSVSTINPDDSSLSFEELDQRMICQPIQLDAGVQNRRYRLQQQYNSNNSKQQRTGGTIGAKLYANNDFYDEEDEDENCCSKSDAEMTGGRATRAHRHFRANNHRRHRQRRTAAPDAAVDNDDGTASPPSRGTQSAPRTPQRHARQPPALEMIEEISPILPRPADVRDDLDIPPLPRPLKLSKEWRPLQTSTLTNFHATLPKTNPHHSGTTKLAPIVPLEPPRSLFDPQYTAMSCGFTASSDELKPIRPEQFNLPSVMAKAKGIRGILFLQLCVIGDSLLKVHIRNGAYFLKTLPISSFVKVEIRRSISGRRRDKYAHHHDTQQRRRRRFCSRLTVPVSRNNQPEFYEEFTFRISRTHLEHGDKLGISVFVEHNGEEKTPELLGGMSFSLVKMMKMAQLHTSSQQQQCFFHYNDHHRHHHNQMLADDDNDDNVSSVKVYEGGFFLLPDKKALTTKFAQDKISIRKYYDDIGGGGAGSTTMSTTVSSMGSPFKMMISSEPEWNAAIAAARFGIGGAGATTNMPTAPAAIVGPPPLSGLPASHHNHRRLFSPLRNTIGGATITTTSAIKQQHQHQYRLNHYPHTQPPLLALAPTGAVMMQTADGCGTVSATAAAASCCAIVDSSVDTSHYTTSNSSSSGAQSAVDYKRTRNGPIQLDHYNNHHPHQLPCPNATGGHVPVVQQQQPLAVPPPSINTTDTTTSDFTSSGFTSSAAAVGGTEMLLGTHHPHLTTALASSFSSGCADVGTAAAGGGIGTMNGRNSISSSGSSSSDDSSSLFAAPVVIELATNIVGTVADGRQPRKASLQHLPSHHQRQYSPMRMHRGGAATVATATTNANNGAAASPQKMAPQQQQSPNKRTQVALPDAVAVSGHATGGAGHNSLLRTAAAGATLAVTAALDDNRDVNDENGASANSGGTTAAVRRVASFTFSPPAIAGVASLRAGCSLQHNQQRQQLLSRNSASGAANTALVFRLDKRNSLAVSAGGTATTDKLQRKMAFGPLSKTLHFLRTKLDFSMSASVLCPSREDCRLWQESFDALLAHKYGCLLFREFLQSEFSDENLEFWLECEAFKRMKPAKKTTAQKANQIFDTFVRELAPKEVNLDSQTRLATQAALTAVPLRTDMFMLAQQKIAQLMAKDSYPRFLKSEQYLELLNNNNNSSRSSSSSIESSSDQSKQQQKPSRGLLRVASAREGSAKSLPTSTGCSRSPSLSPHLRNGDGPVGVVASGVVSPRGGRWSTRRNTCAPVPMSATTKTTIVSAAAIGDTNGTSNNSKIGGKIGYGTIGVGGSITSPTGAGGINAFAPLGGCSPTASPLTLQISSIAE